MQKNSTEHAEPLIIAFCYNIATCEILYKAKENTKENVFQSATSFRMINVPSFTNEEYQDKVINRLGALEWPPRSTDTAI